MELQLRIMGLKVGGSTVNSFFQISLRLARSFANVNQLLSTYNRKSGNPYDEHQRKRVKGKVRARDEMYLSQVTANR